MDRVVPSTRCSVKTVESLRDQLLRPAKGRAHVETARESLDLLNDSVKDVVNAVVITQRNIDQIFENNPDLVKAKEDLRQARFSVRHIDPEDATEEEYAEYIAATGDAEYNYNTLKEEKGLDRAFEMNDMAIDIQVNAIKDAMVKLQLVRKLAAATTGETSEEFQRIAEELDKVYVQMQGLDDDTYDVTKDLIEVEHFIAEVNNKGLSGEALAKIPEMKQKIKNILEDSRNVADLELSREDEEIVGMGTRRDYLETIKQRAKSSLSQIKDPGFGIRKPGSSEPPESSSGLDGNDGTPPTSDGDAFVDTVIERADEIGRKAAETFLEEINNGFGNLLEIPTEARIPEMVEVTPENTPSRLQQIKENLKPPVFPAREPDPIQTPVQTLQTMFDEISARFEQVRLSAETSPSAWQGMLSDIERQLRDIEEQARYVLALIPKEDRMKMGEASALGQIIQRIERVETLQSQMMETLYSANRPPPDPRESLVNLGKSFTTQKKLVKDPNRSVTERTQAAFGIIEREEQAKGAIASLKEQFGENIPDPLKGQFASAKGNVTKAVKEAKKELETLRPQIEVDTNLTEEAKNKLLAEIDSALSTGQNTGRGIVEGIDNSIGEVEEAARRMVTSGSDAADKALDIQSPSGVYREKGEQSGEGYIQGLISKVKEAHEAIREMVDPPRIVARKYKKSVRQQASLLPSTEFDPATLHEDYHNIPEDAQKVIFASAGFTGTKGQSSEYLVSLLRSMQPQDSYMVPFKNANFDTSAPIGEINLAQWGMDAAKATGGAIASGGNQDALQLAKQVFELKQKNPNADVKLIGHSAGGLIIREAQEILKGMGIFVDALSIATPLLGTFEAIKSDAIALMGSGDELRVLSGQKEGIVSGVKSHATEDYLDNETVQQMIMDYLHSGITPDLMARASGVTIDVNAVEIAEGAEQALLEQADDIGQNFGRQVSDGTDDALGIQSPSKVFMEKGRWAAEGFLLGLEEAIGNKPKEIYEEFAREALQVSGLDPSKFDIPNIVHADSTLNAIGSDAIYSGQQNAIGVRYPDPEKGYLGSTKDRMAIAHELRHAMQLKAGKIDLKDLHKGVTPGVELRGNKSPHIQKATEKSLKAAKNSGVPEEYLETLQPMEEDAYNFMLDANEMFYRANQKYKDKFKDYIESNAGEVQLLADEILAIANNFGKSTDQLKGIPDSKESLEASAAVLNNAAKIKRSLAVLRETFKEGMPSNLKKSLSEAESVISKKQDYAGARARAVLNTPMAQESSGVGQDLVDGIKEGVSGSSGDIDEIVEMLAVELIDRIEEEFGIASPSKVFMRIGRSLIDGFKAGVGDGLEDTVDEKLQAVKSILTETTKGGFTFEEAFSGQGGDKILQLSLKALEKGKLPEKKELQKLLMEADAGTTKDFLANPIQEIRKGFARQGFIVDLMNQLMGQDKNALGYAGQGISEAFKSESVRDLSQEAIVNTMGFLGSKAGAIAGPIGVLAGDGLGAVLTRKITNDLLAVYEAIMDGADPKDIQAVVSKAIELKKTPEAIDKAKTNYKQDLTGFTVGNAVGSVSPVPLGGAMAAMYSTADVVKTVDNIRKGGSAKEEIANLTKGLTTKWYSALQERVKQFQLMSQAEAETVEKINDQLEVVSNTYIGKIAGFVSQGVVNVKSAIADPQAAGKQISETLGQFLNIDALKSDAAKVEEIGRSIVEGITLGLVQDGMAEEQARSLAQTILNAVKDELGISSPSKAFEYVAQMCAKGFEKGMGEFNKSKVGQTLIAKLGELKNEALDNIDSQSVELLTHARLAMGETGKELEALVKESKSALEGFSGDTAVGSSEKLTDLAIKLKEIREIGFNPDDQAGDWELEAAKGLDLIIEKLLEASAAGRMLGQAMQAASGDIDMEDAKESIEDVGEVSEKPIGILDELRKKFGSLKEAGKALLKGLIGIFALSKIGPLLKEWGNAAIEAALAFGGIERSMSFVLGSSQAAKDKIADLRAEAKAFGIDANTSIEGYVQLAASTRGTQLEGAPTDQISTAINMAKSAYTLDTQSAERVSTAIAQMASKGTISMEELRQQLGEALPGAFQMAARAMGVTTQQLDKLVASGDVTAEEFLPKLSQQMISEMSIGVTESANSATAAIARFNNAVEELKIGVGNELLPIRKLGLQAMEKGLNVLIELMPYLGAVAGVAALSIINAFVGLKTIIDIIVGRFVLLGKQIQLFAAQGVTSAIRGMTMAFSALFKTLVIMSAQFIAIQALFTAGALALQYFNDMSGKTGQIANDSNRQLEIMRDRLQEIKDNAEGAGKALRDVPLDEKFISEEDKELKNNRLRGTAGGVFGSGVIRSTIDSAQSGEADMGTAFVGGILGGIERSMKRKQSRDDEKATNAMFNNTYEAISNAQTYLSGDNQQVIDDFLEIEKKIEDIQMAQQAIRAVNPDDIDTLKKLQDQEDELQRTRLENQKDLVAARKWVNDELQRRQDALKAAEEDYEAGYINEDEYTRKTNNLKSQIKDLEETQKEFNQQLDAGANKFAELRREAEKIADTLADIKFFSELENSRARLNSAQNVGIEREGTYQFTGDVLNQENLQRQLAGVQQALAQTQGILASPEMQRATNKIREQASQQGVNLDQLGPAGLERMRGRFEAIESDTGLQDALNRMIDVRELESEATNLANQVAEAQRQLEQQLFQSAREIQQYFEEVYFQTQEINVAFKEVANDRKFANASDTVKNATSKFRGNFFSGFMDIIGRLFDVLNKEMQETTAYIRERIGIMQQHAQALRQQQDMEMNLPGVDQGALGGGGRTLGNGQVLDTQIAGNIVNEAEKWDGKNFREGVYAQCAFFVREVFKNAGVELGNISSPGLAGSFFGGEVGSIFHTKDPNTIPEGAIVGFENTYSGPGSGIGGYTHVGIATGNGMMIDRSTSSRPVQERAITTFKPDARGGYTFLIPHAMQNAADALNTASATINNIQGTATNPMSAREGNQRSPAPRGPGRIPRGGTVSQAERVQSDPAGAYALAQAAQQLGLPLDQFVALMSWESAGTLNPNIRGGDGNQYKGLIQFSPSNQSQYGTGGQQSIAQQVPAIVRYLQDRGFQPGQHDIRHAYSAILAGNASERYWNRRDSNGTTVRNAAPKFQQGDHYNRAMQFLRDSGVDPRNAVASAPMQTQSEYERFMREGYALNQKRDYQSALINFRRAAEQRPNDQYAARAIQNVTGYINRGGGSSAQATSSQSDTSSVIAETERLGQRLTQIGETVGENMERSLQITDERRGLARSLNNAEVDRLLNESAVQVIEARYNRDTQALEGRRQALADRKDAEIDLTPMEEIQYRREEIGIEAEGRVLDAQRALDINLNDIEAFTNFLNEFPALADSMGLDESRKQKFLADGRAMLAAAQELTPTLRSNLERAQQYVSSMGAKLDEEAKRLVEQIELGQAQYQNQLDVERLQEQAREARREGRPEEAAQLEAEANRAEIEVDAKTRLDEARNRFRAGEFSTDPAENERLYQEAREQITANIALRLSNLDEELQRSIDVIANTNDVAIAESTRALNAERIEELKLIQGDPIAALELENREQLASELQALDQERFRVINNDELREDTKQQLLANLDQQEALIIQRIAEISDRSMRELENYIQGATDAMQRELQTLQIAELRWEGSPFEALMLEQENQLNEYEQQFRDRKLEIDLDTQIPEPVKQELMAQLDEIERITLDQVARINERAQIQIQIDIAAARIDAETANLEAMIPNLNYNFQSGQARDMQAQLDAARIDLELRQQLQSISDPDNGLDAETREYLTLLAEETAELKKQNLERDFALQKERDMLTMRQNAMTGPGGPMDLIATQDSYLGMYGLEATWATKQERLPFQLEMQQLNFEQQKLELEELRRAGQIGEEQFYAMAESLENINNIKLDQIRQEASEVPALMQQISGPMKGFFSDVLNPNSTKTFGEAFNDMLGSILSNIASFMADQIVNGFMNSFIGGGAGIGGQTTQNGEQSPGLLSSMFGGDQGFIPSPVEQDPAMALQTGATQAGNTIMQSGQMFAQAAQQAAMAIQQAGMSIQQSAAMAGVQGGGFGAQFGPIGTRVNDAAGGVVGALGRSFGQGAETIGNAITSSSQQGSGFFSNVFGGVARAGVGGGGSMLGGLFSKGPSPFSAGGGGLGSIFGSILPMVFSLFGFKEGGEVPEPQIPNYAVGGAIKPMSSHSKLRVGNDAIAKALRKEAGNSVLATLTPGEHVLTVEQARRYKALGLDQVVEGYKTGGTVGSKPISPSNINIQSGGSTSVNVPITINSDGGGEEDSMKLAQKIKGPVQSLIYDIIQKEKRPSGQLYGRGS
jgi:tape measure domain-containing protein